MGVLLGDTTINPQNPSCGHFECNGDVAPKDEGETFRRREKGIQLPHTPHASNETAF